MPTTPLTLYGTRSNSGTLPTANILATLSGGVPGSNNTQLGMHYGYGEVYSQGTATQWPENYSIGVPSGHGWLLDSPLLEGQQTLLGAWSASLQLGVSIDGTVLTADIFTRIYRRSAGGIYTSIGQLILRGQTITGTPAIYIMASRNLAPVVFQTGDKLYIDIFLNVGTNTSTSPTTQLIATMAQASLGVSSSEQVGTPGYVPQPRLDIGMRILLQQLRTTKDMASRMRLQAVQALDIASRLNVGTAYSKLVMQNGVFAYYRLGDMSGVGARDDTFHKNNGTITGSVTPGQPGLIAGDPTTSMLFDGSTGYITLPVRVRPETWTTFSIECWFTLSTTTFATFPALITNEWTYGHSKGFQIVLGSNAASIELDVSNGTYYQTVFYGNRLSTNTWYHFAGTYDGSTLSGYLNGALFASVPFTGPLAASSFPITIGAFPPSSTQFFPGSIQEVALYTTALSAGQVLADYNAGGHRLPDLATRLLLQ